MRQKNKEYISIYVYIICMVASLYPLISLFLHIAKYWTKTTGFLTTLDIFGATAIETFTDNPFGIIGSVFYVMGVVFGFLTFFYFLGMILDKVGYYDFTSFLIRINQKLVIYVLIGISFFLGSMTILFYSIYNAIEYGSSYSGYQGIEFAGYLLMIIPVIVFISVLLINKNCKKSE